MIPLLKVLEKHPGIENAYPFGEFHHIVLENNTKETPVLDGIEINRIVPNIEDVFIDLMRIHA
jgi:ABC-type lipoprotein release transport system permease subunit